MALNIGYLGVHPINILQRLPTQNLPAAAAVYLPVFQQYKIVTESKCQIQIVDNHNGSQPIRIADIPNDLQNLVLVLNIQRTGWFIEKQDARSLRQCPRQPLGDSRLERALAELDELISGTVAARQLAQAAHLSLSQLERLFGEHLGLPIRRLVLWRRLRLALAQVLAGSSLTVAAHNAGFADSAHFSRTMKKLFGVSAGRSLPPLECRLLD